MERGEAEGQDGPNSQLLGWVKEWLDVARERNSKGMTTYKHAYESLKACPLTFQHPAELQQLKGFGPKLCERLTEQLKKHCEENDQPMPPHPQAKKAAEKAAAGQGGARPARKARKAKSYVPAFRSGAYALIVGLATLGEEDSTGMTKAELIEAAQPHCDSSFTAPSDPTKFYTAWNSIKTLMQKDLLPAFTPITLPPGSFTVQLLLDVREVRAKTDRDYMKEELAKQGVTPVMRSLELGDAQWVARCHDPTALSRQGAEGDEVVLDWIVERKRLDDLIGSIKDGRFHEQKFRLGRSGVKKVVYVIEEIAMDPASAQRYDEAVQSAIASTQVVNGYFVKKTAKMDDTIKYLTRMTVMLKRTYEARPLHVIPTRVITAQNYLPLLKHVRATLGPSYYVTYAAFSSLASKSEIMTLRDLFLKMLMTTKGLTGERALEIQKKWKTPYGFVKAFEACGPGEAGKKRKRDMVFSHMGSMVGRKKVSKSLSQKIAEVWGEEAAR
ncbi:crossover junction endonuclease MUS81 [Geosmithia morbida]|uniref:Crossover junction endonuclease MUS81 n=1 Tax=Geosmithia morbida TaxID=1094350 RepID=A0A9P5D089_9HYPO|nr:crossover junction endonuclease MUS81 [Geosmithia morbida]KAF4122478.1 crossover junction endonuclease MUS81 [Geosmithia morbida]